MRPASGAPRVVACMPAWNGEAFIARTLASLAAQTYGNLRIVISDDASTDRTQDICAQFARGSSRVTYVRQPINLGWIDNVNALLRRAEQEADYLFFAFHDDPLEPAYVARLVAALEEKPNAVLAFTDVDLGDRVVAYRELDGVTDARERVRRLLARVDPWWAPNRGLFRSFAAARAGYMQRHVAGEFMADWPWLVRLALQGEFVRVPEPLVHKVWLDRGLTRVWGHTVWQKTGVTLACAKAIRGAGFPPDTELALYRELLAAPLRRRWWQLHTGRSR